jgi:hypothetical protein
VSSAACQVMNSDQWTMEEKVSKINGLFRVSSGLSWDRQTDFLSTELFDQVAVLQNFLCPQFFYVRSKLECLSLAGLSGLV